MPRQNAPIAARLIGLVPLGVGTLVLAGVWFGFGGMPLDDIPLFGKLFASLVASVFLFVGLGFLTAGKTLKGSQGGAVNTAGSEEPAAGSSSQSASSQSASSESASSQSAKGWSCPQCGAPLGEDTRISPSGDVLCPFCENWFNVRS